MHHEFLETEAEEKRLEEKKEGNEQKTNTGVALRIAS